MSASQTSEMPSGPGKVTLTLIVATTPVTRTQGPSPLLGIGLNGTLPWPRIKSDMAFFARVTTRPPSAPAATAATSTSKVNAIVMGRKTYYSLPKSLRPLKERLNVVVSRDTTGSVAEEVAKDLARQREKNNNNNNNNKSGQSDVVVTTEDKRDAFVSHSLESALDRLLAQRAEGEDGLGHIFVIGGGELYNSALKLGPSSNVLLRILMTRVKKTADGEEYECDTFFPLTDEDLVGNKSWREAGVEELESWVGERVPKDWVEEGEVATKIVGYERVI